MSETIKNELGVLEDILQIEKVVKNQENNKIITQSDSNLVVEI